MAYTGTGTPVIRQGNEMIAFMKGTDISKYFNGSMDNASLNMWYREDPLNNHLGLMTYWNKQKRSGSLSLFDEIMTQRNVLTVNGEDGTFTYDVEVEKDTGCYIEEDGSHQINAGIDESIFYVTLNKEYAPGTVLTYDDMDGEQFIVADLNEGGEVEPTGTGFKHPVQYVTNNKRASFPTQYLTKGTEYFVVSHALAEYSTKYAKVEMPDTPDKQRFEFRLGSASGVEAWLTSMAGSKSMNDAVLSVSSKEYKNELLKEMDEKGLGEFAVRIDLGANGKPNTKTANIGSTLEYLVMRQLHKMMGTKLMFQKAAEIRSSNGMIRLNEGLWHQLQRGFTVEYGRRNGITRQHIQYTSEYIFANSDLDVKDRWMKFRCGTEAYYNVLELFSEEVKAQLTALSPLLGQDRILPKSPVSGELNNLQLDPVTFTRVFLPTIGNVEIILDKSLDYGARSDRFAKGMHAQGRNWTTGAMIMWDASSPEYSNRGQGIPEGTKLENGANANGNIFLVKPEGPMMYSGTENGRWSPVQSKDIVASQAMRGQGIWSWSIGDVWVKDLTKFVIIQPDRKLRKGYN